MRSKQKGEKTQNCSNIRETEKVECYKNKIKGKGEKENSLAPAVLFHFQTKLQKKKKHFRNEIRKKIFPLPS